MDLKVSGEDLSHVDCGGGYRETSAHVHYDNTLPEMRQMQSVVMEALGCKLEALVGEEALNDLADFVVDALLQWREITENEKVRTE